MEYILKNLFSNREFRVAFFLLLASLLLFVISPQRVGQVLKDNIDFGIKILALSIVAVVISVVIHYLIPADFAEKHLKGNKVIYLVSASILGILTPGPVYAIYPIVFALKKRGIQNPILVSYITGQTIIGPARVPFEVGLFGLKFFLYRLVLSVIMGPLAGLLYIMISKRFPDKNDTNSIEETREK
jgi:uncharacterized membrane protein YraQ (UPF0718 family)